MHSSAVTRFFIHLISYRLLSVVFFLTCISGNNVHASGSLFFAFGSTGVAAGGGQVPLDLVFQGSKGLAGLQLMIIRTSDAIRFASIARGERIQDPTAWGFDYSITQEGDTLRAVLWSRTGRGLDGGTYSALLNISVSVHSNGSSSLVLKDVQSALADGQGSPANIVIGSPASVDISVEEKMEAHLSQNYPNPCNPSTLIRYVVPEEGHVTLKVYNALGEEVRTVVDNVLAAGEFEVTFSMEGLPSGMYFYRLSGSGFDDVRKMMLLK